MKYQFLPKEGASQAFACRWIPSDWTHRIAFILTLYHLFTFHFPLLWTSYPGQPSDQRALAKM